MKNLVPKQARRKRFFSTQLYMYCYIMYFLNQAAKTLHKAFRKAKSSPHKQRKDMVCKLIHNHNFIFSFLLVRFAVPSLKVKNVLKAKKSLNLDIKAQDQWPTPG